jgi:hypothetical protein
MKHNVCFGFSLRLGKKLLNYWYVTSPFMGVHIIHVHVCIFVISDKY